jgi:hypothetical protein
MRGATPEEEIGDAEVTNPDSQQGSDLELSGMTDGEVPMSEQQSTPAIVEEDETMKDAQAAGHAEEVEL